jgi:hypothetical protein
MHRIFILSPARTDGKRASILMSQKAEFDLAKRLRSSAGAPLGEVFSFLSGLYFRGKLAYSQRFATGPDGHGVPYIITSNSGLMQADEPVWPPRLNAFREVPIDPLEPRYIDPLRASVAALHRRLPIDCQVVLLGSIATNKYSDSLVEAFGARLMFPRDFIGRGDMSRGGLLLRAVRSGDELGYVALSEVASRRGKRPPKLPRLRGGDREASQPGVD